MFKFIYDQFVYDPEYGRTVRNGTILMCLVGFICLVIGVYSHNQFILNTMMDNYKYKALLAKDDLNPSSIHGKKHNTSSTIIQKLPEETLECELYLIAFTEFLNVYSKELFVEKSNIKNVCIIGGEVSLKLKEGVGYGET